MILKAKKFISSKRCDYSRLINPNLISDLFLICESIFILIKFSAFLIKIDFDNQIKFSILCFAANKLEKVMGTSISSQPKIEEVKQVPTKKSKPHRLKGMSLILVNSFSRLSKLIYQNYLTFGRRDNHELSNFSCLVFN